MVTANSRSAAIGAASFVTKTVDPQQSDEPEEQLAPPPYGASCGKPCSTREPQTAGPIDEWIADAANGQIGDGAGEIVICGEHLVNTAVNDAASAVEALCVSVKGDSRLQLARQLTAAALNCVISGGASDCSTVPAYDLVFEACNAACAANTADTFAGCIAELDCLNNGGLFDAATGFCQTGHCSDNDAPCNDGDRSQCASSTATCVPLVGTCHDQPLCPVGFPGLCFDETGPAGSSNACNSANGTSCTIVGAGETKCAVDSATIK